MTWEETKIELEACKEHFRILQEPDLKNQDHLALKLVRIRCRELGDIRYAILSNERN